MEVTWIYCGSCGLNDKIELLSTTNEWPYYCARCDLRLDEDGNIMPTDGDTSE